MSEAPHDDLASAGPRRAALITALQSHGLRVEVPMETRARRGGPGRRRDALRRGRRSDGADRGRRQPRLAVRAARRRRRRWAVYRDGARLAGAAPSPAARATTTSTTADGIPYWQIALLHLDSVASTVLQTCAYWGNDDQCRFCGIGVVAGRRPHDRARRRPRMLAEVAVAAKELDGAVDATLTTGSTATPDRGAMYVGRCGAGRQGGGRACRCRCSSSRRPTST